VLDANRNIALITTSNSLQLATLSLDTGTVRELGLSSPGGMSGALSPDGTQAAIHVRNSDGTYEILIVDLGSCAVRPLIQIGPNEYNRAGLDPLVWTTAGIVVSPAVWDCSRANLLTLDPQSGKLTPLAQGPVGVFSPDGRLMAASAYVNLGEPQYSGQCGWHNRLTAGPIGLVPAVIAEQKSTDFTAFDIANDGSVLYLADDAPFASNPPAPDRGIYWETGGKSVRQLGETRIGQWVSGRFVTQGEALVSTVTRQGATGTVEIDLVSLCATSGCTPTIRPVETFSGMYPQPVLIVLPQGPAA
jgi:hypothetical protein